MAPPAQSSGPNWMLFAKLAAGIGVVGVVLMVAPMCACTLADVARSEPPALAGESNAQLEAIRAVAGSDGWFAHARGAFRTCHERNPIFGAPIWQQAGAGIGFVLFLVFATLASVDRRRQLRLGAAKQRQARKSLRKERASRPTGTAGYTTVHGTSDHAAAESGDHELVSRSESTDAPNMRTEPSGLRKIVDASDDPLAGLDARLAPDVPFVTTPVGEPLDVPPAIRPHATETVPKAGPAAIPSISKRHKTADLPSLEDLAQDQKGWDDEVDGWESFPDEPYVTGAHDVANEAAEAISDEAFGQVGATSDTLPAQPAPRGLADAIAAKAPPQRAVDANDALAIGEAETFPPFGGSGGPADDAPSGAQLRLDRAEFVGVAEVGKPFAIDLIGVGLTNDLSAVQLGLAIEARSGERINAWSLARTLASAGKRSPTANGIRLTIQWREIEQPVLDVARREADSVAQLHVTITADERVMRVSTRIVDALAADFRTVHGAPLRPRTVLVTAPDERVVRGWIGAKTPGMLIVEGLEPGLCKLEFEDGSFVGHPGGAMHRTVHMTTNGVAFAEPSESSDPQPHDLCAFEPAVVYASTFATGAQPTGQRDAPFPSIRAALEFALERRRSGAEEFEAIEIRVDPSARLPTSRHGLSKGNGTTQWLNWWTGQPADTTVEWCRAAGIADLRAEAAADTVAFAEELQLEGIENLRIVNSAYAGLRERIAMSPGFEVSMPAELGAIPLALVTAPPTGASTGFRLEIIKCLRVHVEGLHFLGCEAQSGIAIRDAQAVTIRRCWLDLFSSGTTPRSGVFGVGRGVQIDTSGGKTPDQAIVVDTCDVGWNRAARRAVPIRGAGVSVFESNVEITRCYVHHNQATQAPPDLVAQGASSVKGSQNHRAGNKVLLI